jgi:hypothetical protein
MIGALLRGRERTPTRQQRPLSVNGYAQLWQDFRFNGHRYWVHGTDYSVDESMANTVVGACIGVRGLILSEARLLFQHVEFGATADHHGDHSHRVLEFYDPILDRLNHPWPGATSGHLLSQMDLDASLYGNSYWYPEDDGTLTWLDPTRMKVATGSMQDFRTGSAYGERLLGFSYHEPNGAIASVFLPGELVHFRPLAGYASSSSSSQTVVNMMRNPFVGASWAGRCFADTEVDSALTGYKTAYVRNSSRPALAVTFNPEHEDPDLKEFAEAFEAKHQGVGDAFKTVYLTGGADVKTIGSNFAEIEMKAVQGAGESRIAMSAGVPAPILGNSEGLAGSSLNTGNYNAARRRFGDGTLRPLWRDMCAALAEPLPTIQGMQRHQYRLWYSERDVYFLQEDVKDAAEITQIQAAAINGLIANGWDPNAARDAVVNNDLSTLEHTGLLSVQLHPPGESGTIPDSEPTTVEGQ